MNNDLSSVTRLELIDHTKSSEDGGGRSVVFWDLRKHVVLSLQDDGRTLKVFVDNRPPTLAEAMEAPQTELQKKRVEEAKGTYDKYMNPDRDEKLLDEFIEWFNNKYDTGYNSGIFVGAGDDFLKERKKVDNSAES